MSLRKLLLKKSQLECSPEPRLFGPAFYSIEYSTIVAVVEHLQPFDFQPALARFDSLFFVFIYFMLVCLFLFTLLHFAFFLSLLWLWLVISVFFFKQWIYSFGCNRIWCTKREQPSNNTFDSNLDIFGANAETISCDEKLCINDKFMTSFSPRMKFNVLWEHIYKTIEKGKYESHAYIYSRPRQAITFILIWWSKVSFCLISARLFWFAKGLAGKYTLKTYPCRAFQIICSEIIANPFSNSTFFLCCLCC